MKLLKMTVGVMFLVAALGVGAISAEAADMGMGMQSGATVTAGFTGLPLRNCEGLYCGVLNTLPYGQSLNVLLYDSADGWSYVEVAGTGERGWVCNENVF